MVELVAYVERVTNDDFLLLSSIRFSSEEGVKLPPLPSDCIYVIEEDK